jgi:hypothetical protein
MWYGIVRKKFRKSHISASGHYKNNLDVSYHVDANAGHILVGTAVGGSASGSAA